MGESFFDKFSDKLSWPISRLWSSGLSIYRRGISKSLNRIHACMGVKENLSHKIHKYQEELVTVVCLCIIRKPINFILFLKTFIQFLSGLWVHNITYIWPGSSVLKLRLVLWIYFPFRNNKTNSFLILS